MVILPFPLLLPHFFPKRITLIVQLVDYLNSQLKSLVTVWFNSLHHNSLTYPQFSHWQPLLILGKRKILSAMSLAGKGYSDPQENSNNYNNNASSNCCSEALAQLKLYQAFIFSVPILFAFILLLLFYLFYLRRQRVDWSSLRMRTSTLHAATESDDLSRVCKKETTFFFCYFYFYSYLWLNLIIIIFGFCWFCDSVKWDWRRRWGRCCLLLSSRRVSLSKRHSKSACLNFLMF